MTRHREGLSNAARVTQAPKGRVSPESSVQHGYSERHVSFRLASSILERIDEAALQARTTRSDLIRRGATQLADVVLRRNHD